MNILIVITGGLPSWGPDDREILLLIRVYHTGVLMIRGSCYYRVYHIGVLIIEALHYSGIYFAGGPLFS